ncbi:MAG TPA: hypothetical protein VGY31_16190 [Terriglobia bacterium]|nr:hypothetical protein [Terriglobia bacterium]
MKKQAISVFFAVLVVLASTGLRRTFAKAESAAALWNNSSFSTAQPAAVIPHTIAIGGSPVPVPPYRTVAGIGGSPVPVPPYRTVAGIGGSPVPVPPYRTVAGIGGSPVPVPPYRTVLG